jgi:hypothetical protein
LNIWLLLVVAAADQTLQDMTLAAAAVALEDIEVPLLGKILAEGQQAKVQFPHLLELHLL